MKTYLGMVVLHLLAFTASCISQYQLVTEDEVAIYPFASEIVST